MLRSSLSWTLVLALTLASAAQEIGYHVCVRPQAGRWEKQAAIDLAHCLEKMTGHPPGIGGQPQLGAHNLYVGEVALEIRPQLRERLQQVAKQNPRVRADAITLQTVGPDLFLAGTNDDSHYFAAAELMRRWGCRWYLPAPWGEHIPSGTPPFPILDYSYAPPFEVRQIWVSWNGNREGWDEFAHRNFLNQQAIPSGHALGRYLKGLNGFSFLSEESARQVAAQVESQYRQGKSFSLSIEDAVLSAKTPAEVEFSANLRDKYFQCPVLTDVYLTFLNHVAACLRTAAPDSVARIGFLAYANLTQAPQRVQQVEPALYAYLAPIDFDPNHAFGDPRSAAKADLLGCVQRWVQVMEGRVVIYDYDQGMLVWRDVPNPSQDVVARDVRTLRELGILGFGTESRNAGATTFLNLFFRGQLYWNPDLDVEAELQGFYKNFYGRNAPAMKKYWTALFDAWKQTPVTEHEVFALPVIYSRELVASLRPLIQALQGDDERIRFTRLGFEVLDAYTEMVHAAASECDYARAVQAGERGLEARRQLTALHDSLTTYTRMPEKGPAFWPGEVEQYRALNQLRAIRPTPLQWSFRADPDDHGVWQNWADSDTGPEWSPLRTDLYLQAQLPDVRPGFAWYTTRLQVPSDAHLRFPGLFNESWLYVDGVLQQHRTQKPLWWQNDYAFEWDVPLPAGEHRVTLRTVVPQHFAGLFRRPFLYRP